MRAQNQRLHKSCRRELTKANRWDEFEGIPSHRYGSAGPKATERKMCRASQATEAKAQDQRQQKSCRRNLTKANRKDEFEGIPSHRHGSAEPKATEELQKRTDEG